MNLWNRCRKIVYFILFAVLIPFSTYIFYGALDNLRYANALQGVLTKWQVPIVVMGTSFFLCILLAGVFRFVVPRLEKHEKTAVIALFLLSFCIQLLTMRILPASFRNDHLKVFDTAYALLQGGVIADQHYFHYFMKFPNNIPLCLFTYGCLKAASFFGVPEIYFMDLMKVINLLFMNAALWFGFQMLCRHRSKRTGLYFLLLTLVDPLWYLLGQMYYTSTISMAFSMGAVWLFDQAGTQKKSRKKYILYFLMGMSLAAGFQIRATAVITIAALLIYAVLQTEHLDLKKQLISLLAAGAGIFLIFAAYGKLEARYTGFDPDETGYPAVHWVMMSAQNDGQYNSADDAFTGSFSTKEERTAADMDRLKERIQAMGPRGIFTLWKNKLRVAFSDGTDDYYSFYRTMRKTSPIQKYINGGRSDYLALYLHGYHGMIMGLLLVAFLMRCIQRRRNRLDIFALNLCGAYLFYLIWEVDQAYSIPFMLMFLLEAADGMDHVENVLTTGKEKYPEAVRCMYSAAITAAILLVFWALRVVHRVGLPVREYSVVQDQESSQDLTLQTEFVQTFRTGKIFDHVALWVANWDGPANDSIYDVQILDEDGEVRASGELIGAMAPCIDSYTVAFDPVIPDGEQTFSLHVKTRTPDAVFPVDFLYYQSGGWDVYADGSLYAPEEIFGVDLAFSVYKEN